MTAYSMCINNAKSYIRNSNPNSPEGNINAFTFSEVIAICFCKCKEEVLMDLVLDAAAPQK